MSSADSVPTPREGKTEVKVKVAAVATYLLGLGAAIFLSTTATDFVRELPDWLEAIVYPALLAAGTFVAGRQAKSNANSLAPSTIEAAKQWLRTRAQALPGDTFR